MTNHGTQHKNEYINNSSSFQKDLTYSLKDLTSNKSEMMLKTSIEINGFFPSYLHFAIRKPNKFFCSKIQK